MILQLHTSHLELQISHWSKSTLQSLVLELLIY